jgi:PAS domain S-box-containing protein
MPMAIALKSGQPVRGMEIVAERPDGSRVTIQPYPTPLRDASGELVGAVNVLVDISDRKRVEAALRESESRFRFLADNAPAMIWMAGPDGTTQFMSKGFLRFTGRREQDQSDGWVTRIHSEDRERYVETAAAARQKRTRFEVEYRLRRRDLAYRWVIDRAAPIHTPDGEFLGYVGTLLDVTERHEAEEQMREAAHLKDEFLGLVSHELRTPIATIVGNALLLQRRGDRLPEVDRTQSVADILVEAEKLQEIIEHLLLVTRLEAGQVDIEPIVLKRVVAEEVGHFRRRHPERPVLLTGGDGAMALGQPTFVSLVLRNLLSNAEKYSSEGAPIEVSIEPAAGDTLQVRVRDHGIGLDGEDLDDIFSPFYRSPRARERAKGMGLGLAVCKRAGTALGGQIAAVSHGEAGSEFYFSLKSTGANDEQ